jgi:hypothetical protein
MTSASKPPTSTRTDVFNCGKGAVTTDPSGIGGVVAPNPVA